MSDSIKKWEEICEIKAQLKVEKKADIHKYLTDIRNSANENFIKIILQDSKDDALKMKNLIIDLQNLKSKYSFKSKKNKLIYQTISVFIDKVIAYTTK